MKLIWNVLFEDLAALRTSQWEKTLSQCSLVASLIRLPNRTNMPLDVTSVRGYVYIEKEIWWMRCRGINIRIEVLLFKRQRLMTMWKMAFPKGERMRGRERDREREREREKAQKNAEHEWDWTRNEEKFFSSSWFMSHHYNSDAINQT